MNEFTDLGPHGVPVPFRIILDAGSQFGIPSTAIGEIRVTSLEGGVVVFETATTQFFVQLSEETAAVLATTLETQTVTQAAITDGNILQIHTLAGETVRIDLSAH